MENTFFKNLLEQFPYISLILVISVGLIYLIKLILNAQKDYSQTNLNDEVRQLLLSDQKNKKLIESLRKLQILLYESDESLKSILLKSNYVEVDELTIVINTYINKLPDNWKFMKSFTLEKESISNLKKVNSQAILVKGNNSNLHDTSNYQRQIQGILVEIENLLNIILEHNKKINSNISFLERYKGLGLLSIVFIFVTYNYLSTTDYANKLAKGSLLEEKYIATIKRQEASIDRVNNKLKITSLARIEAEKKLEDYKKDENKTLRKKIRIKIEWGLKDDLDLSIRLPNGNIIDYNKKNNSLFHANLNSDIQRGPGMEEIRIDKPLNGSYEICIHNYSKNNIIKFKIYKYLEQQLIWNKKVDKKQNRQCFKFILEDNKISNIKIVIENK